MNTFPTIPIDAMAACRGGVNFGEIWPYLRDALGMFTGSRGYGDYSGGRDYYDGRGYGDYSGGRDYYDGRGYGDYGGRKSYGDRGYYGGTGGYRDPYARA